MVKTTQFSLNLKFNYYNKLTLKTLYSNFEF